MREWESQSHVRWYCRYHVVIILKYRRKSMFGALRREIGPILKELCSKILTWKVFPKTPSSRLCSSI